jgi:hypothetical protein
MALTIITDGSFHVGVGVGTVTISADITTLGDGDIDVDQNVTTTGNVNCAASGKTTTFSGNNWFTIQNGVLTLSNGGTLTINRNLILYCSTQTDPLVPNGATINGNNILWMQVYKGITVNMPALSMGAGVSLYFYGYQSSADGLGKFDFQGNAYCENIYLYKNSTGPLEVDFNNYTIGCSGATTGFIDFRNNSATNSITLTGGTSTVGLVKGLQFHVSDNPVTLDFNTSTWTMGGDVTLLSNVTVTNTAATITFDGASAQTVETEGETMPHCIFQQDANLNGGGGYDRLQLTAGQTYTFEDGVTVQVDNYTDGDWDGTDGNYVTLVSADPGTPWNLSMQGIASVEYVNATDSNASLGNAVTALLSNGCVDGGNNENWIFTLGGTLTSTMVNAVPYAIRTRLKDLS